MQILQNKLSTSGCFRGWFIVGMQLISLLPDKREEFNDLAARNKSKQIFEQEENNAWQHYGCS